MQPNVWLQTITFYNPHPNHTWTNRGFLETLGMGDTWTSGVYGWLAQKTHHIDDCRKVSALSGLGSGTDRKVCTTVLICSGRTSPGACGRRASAAGRTIRLPPCAWVSWNGFVVACVLLLCQINKTKQKKTTKQSGRWSCYPFMAYPGEPPPLGPPQRFFALNQPTPSWNPKHRINQHFGFPVPPRLVQIMAIFRPILGRFFFGGKKSRN